MDFISMRISPDMFGRSPLQIVGAGSLGVRYFLTAFVCGVPWIELWDGDKVEEHNRFNQGYRACDIGYLKVERLLERAKEIYPDSPCKVVLHPHMIEPGTRLPGYVMMGVDSMTSRSIVLENVRGDDDVKFVVDGRVGATGGKAYGFDPGNEYHVHRYGSEPHMHEDPPEALPGCKGETPMPYMADIVAGHVWTRLAAWKQLEAGCEDPFMNFIGWGFKPEYVEVHECWDEEGEA